MATPLRPPVSARNNSAEPGKAKQSGGPYRWAHELDKFADQKVTVTYLLGVEVVTVTGKLVAWRHDGLHCVIDTAGESVMVRIPLSISRTRSHNSVTFSPERP